MREIFQVKHFVQMMINFQLDIISFGVIILLIITKGFLEYKQPFKFQKGCVKYILLKFINVMIFMPILTVMQTTQLIIKEQNSIVTTTTPTTIPSHLTHPLITATIPTISKTTS